MIFFVILSVYVALQLYLLGRLLGFLKNRIRSPRRTRVCCGAALVFFLLMFLPLAWIMLFGLLPHNPYPWPIRADMLLFAIWAVGSMGSALILLGSGVIRHMLSRIPQRPKALNLQRRQFLKMGAGAAVAAPFILSGYGTLVGRRRFELEHFDLPLSGLSTSMSQLTVVQLTDIHLGPFMPPEELAAYVEAVNRLEPDLIALTGDFISSSPAEVKPCVDVLSGLKARHGIYACLGNHDAYAGVEEELTRLFAETGVQVLRNDAVSLRIRDTTLNILGIDDLRWSLPDLPRALQLAEREAGEVRLLLSHRPEIFPAAAQSGVEVVLSGHYHGGQVKLARDPTGLSVARLLTPYAEGLFLLPRRHQPVPGSAKNSVLFVGRGIGITGLPIRINCPPQIAHLTLRKA